jgi:hypothetical protein
MSEQKRNYLADPDPEFIARFHERKRKKNIAEKIISGKKLSQSEKIEIYVSLTGNRPPLKPKGRPSTVERDIGIAVEYLRDLETRGVKMAGTIRMELTQKYRLPSSRENTFYTALNKGIWEIEKVSNGIIANPESTEDDLGMCERMLKRIKWYKTKN